MNLLIRLDKRTDIQMKKEKKIKDQNVVVEKKDLLLDFSFSIQPSFFSLLPTSTFLYIMIFFFNVENKQKKKEDFFT